MRRKDRERAREFLAEGPQSVREALAAGSATVVLIDRGQLARYADLIEIAEGAGVDPRTVEVGDLAGLTDTVHPQGIVAVCAFVDRPADDVITRRARLLVVCADVRDPGNAGTVIRSADAFGADGVVLSAGSVDPYNPKTVRSTAGSLFHLPVVVGADLPTVTTAARAAGLQVLAADGRGSIELSDLQASGGLARPTLWLFGNEAWGLTDDVAALADHGVRVPIFGRAESLNLASAAAVCLYASATAQRT